VARTPGRERQPEPRQEMVLGCAAGGEPEEVLELIEDQEDGCAEGEANDDRERRTGSGPRGAAR
jgi:hypothetical protein